MEFENVASILEDQRCERTLIGRKRELAALKSGLQRAINGTPTIFLLSGEAGVGKSGLAIEFASLARGSGAKVVYTRCAADLDEIPPQCWSAPDRYDTRPAAVESHEPGTFEAGPTPPVPASTPWELITQTASPRLFEATARALIEKPRLAPLVLILDDLHAADTHSVRALRSFLRFLSNFASLTIGIYREAEVNRFRQVSMLLADPLLKDGSRISLTGLPSCEVAEFIEVRTGKRMEGAALDSIMELTAGNPRLLDIAVRHNLLGEFLQGRVGRISGGVRAELEAHIEPLSLESKATLCIAAVIGREFELSALAHVSEQRPNDVLDTLVQAEQAGLIAKMDRPGRFHFAQALMRHALYEGLTGGNRARLHKRVGEVLEILHRQDETYLTRIAHHYYEAALVGGAAKAIEYCCKAAEYAATRSRWHDAAHLYEMAVVAFDLIGSADEGKRRELCLVLEESRRKTDRAANQNGECASSLDSDDPDPPAGPDIHHRGQLVSVSLQKEPSADERRGPGVSIEDLSGLQNPWDPSQTAPGSSGGRCTPTVVLQGGDSDHRFVAYPGANLVSAMRNGLTIPRADANQKHHENSVRREGDFWTLSFEQRVLRLKQCNGLVFIAYLLQHPKQEFHAVQIAALISDKSALERPFLSRADMQRLGVPAHAGTGGGALLDASAKSSYRRRIGELRDELAEATSFNDLGRISKLNEELGSLGTELSRAVGLGGRNRQHRSESERARVNVTNAIRSLVKRVAADHPALGRYLSTTIKTGYFCSYNPDPRFPQSWRF